MAEEKWLVDGPKTIETRGVRRLRVALVGGRVDVVGSDAPVARVEVQSVTGRDLKVAVEGDTLVVDHPQLRWDDWAELLSFRGRATAVVTITVPRTVAVKIAAVQAKALISGLEAEASVSTASGDVTIDSVTGDLQLHSVSGELAVLDHVGRVSARTVSGEVTVAGTASVFSTDTVSGDVFVDLSGTPDSVAINTVSGTVTVRLEADVPASYAVNTLGGRLRIDGTDVRGVRGRFASRSGSLDGAYVDVRVNSVGGDIAVLHAVRV